MSEQKEQLLPPIKQSINQSISPSELKSISKQLTEKFDESQLHFAQRAESINHQLIDCLERTKHSGPLCRDRLNTGVQLLQSLVDASPNNQSINQLIENLIAAIYVEEGREDRETTNQLAVNPLDKADRTNQLFGDQSINQSIEQQINQASPFNSPISQSITQSPNDSLTLSVNPSINQPIDPSNHYAHRQTFFELVRCLNSKHSDVHRSLVRIGAQVNYYEQHSGGHRDALLIAINKWQRAVTATAFKQWRQNVARVAIQRTRLRDIWKTWQKLTINQSLTYSFKLWRTHRERSNRTNLMPQLIDARQLSDKYSQDIQSNNQFIETAQLRLGHLIDEITETQRAAQLMTGKVSQLQKSINQFSAFRLTDVASYLLELVREMIASLTDEIKFAQSAYKQDPFKMLLEFDTNNQSINQSINQKNMKKKGKKANTKSDDFTENPVNQSVNQSINHATIYSDTAQAQLRLSSMSDPELLLLWLNYHLRNHCHTHSINQSIRRKYQIENLSTDIRNCVAFLVLCEEITPKNWLKAQLHEVRDEYDEDQRARLLLAIVHDFDEDAAQVLTPEAIIHSTQPDQVAVFVGKLFSHHPGLAIDHSDSDLLLCALADMRREWEAMTTRVHKLKQKMKERENNYRLQRQQIYQLRKQGKDQSVNQSNDSVTDRNEQTVNQSTDSSTQSTGRPTEPTGSTVRSDGPKPEPTTSSDWSGGAPMFDELSPDDSAQYTRYAERFLVQFLRIYRQARFELDRAKHCHEVFLALQSRIDRFVLSALVQRLQGKPIALPNVRDVRDREVFTRLPINRCGELFASASTSDSEFALMNAELGSAFVELKKIFRFYASDEFSVGSCMTLKDFHAFVADCRLVGPSVAGGQKSAVGKDATVRAFDAVFNECAEAIDSVDESDEAMTSSRQRVQVTPGRFIELLVRLACVKYKAAPSMSDRFSMLLRHSVLKHARKLDSDSFRLRYANTEILDMVRKHKKKIRRMFEVCLEREQILNGTAPIESTEDMNAPVAALPVSSVPRTGLGNGFSATIDVGHVINIFKGAKVIGGDGGMLLEEFYMLLTHSRKSDFLTTAGIIGPIESLRLEYNEFVELLIACACVRYPDPYTPMAQRVDHFFARELNIIFK